MQELRSMLAEMKEILNQQVTCLGLFLAKKKKKKTYTVVFQKRFEVLSQIPTGHDV